MRMSQTWEQTSPSAKNLFDLSRSILSCIHLSFLKQLSLSDILRVSHSTSEKYTSKYFTGINFETINSIKKILNEFVDGVVANSRYSWKNVNFLPCNIKQALYRRYIWIEKSIPVRNVEAIL